MADGRTDDRDAALHDIATNVAFETFTSAAGDLIRLGHGKDAPDAAIAEIAHRTAAALVEQTRSAQPFDPGETAIVVSAFTAAFLSIFVGTLRTVTAFERQRLGPPTT